MERLLPQLVMVRRGLKDLPPLQAPPPYALRTFREGDEPAWEKIIAQAFDKPSGAYRFDHWIRRFGGFSPERVFFVVRRNGKAVATASALPQTIAGHTVPGLHMVGVLRRWRGKKLGHWASLAALHRLAEEGAENAFLLTDDFRLAALKTYLRLDFEPYLVHENQRERWPRAFAALGDDGDWTAKFSRVMAGPVHKKRAPDA